MVKREDLEALVDTVEILSNPATMQEIKKSDRDIRQGRVKAISSVDDLLDECAWWRGSSSGPILFLKAFPWSGAIKKVVAELSKKLKRLSEDPMHVGGWLSGSLHGKKSTRIAKQYRLIFLPDESEQVVYLVLIDQREHAYDWKWVGFYEREFLFLTLCVAPVRLTRSQSGLCVKHLPEVIFSWLNLFFNWQPNWQPPLQNVPGIYVKMFIMEIVVWGTLSYLSDNEGRMGTNRSHAEGCDREVNVVNLRSLRFVHGINFHFVPMRPPNTLCNF